MLDEISSVLGGWGDGGEFATAGVESGVPITKLLFNGTVVGDACRVFGGWFQSFADEKKWYEAMEFRCIAVHERALLKCWNNRNTIGFTA